MVLEGELYMIGMHITPLISASTHVKPDPTRTRKLLLHRRQIDTLIGKVERAGYALVPIDLHYSKGRIKAEIGLAKGKKLHDKRDSEKEKDWKREQGRLLKNAGTITNPVEKSDPERLRQPVIRRHHAHTGTHRPGQ